MLNAFHDWRTTNSTRDMRFVGIDSTDRDLELKFETFDNLFLVLSWINPQKRIFAGFFSLMCQRLLIGIFENFKNLSSRENFELSVDTVVSLIELANLAQSRNAFTKVLSIPHVFSDEDASPGAQWFIADLWQAGVERVAGRVQGALLSCEARRGKGRLRVQKKYLFNLLVQILKFSSIW